MEGVIEGNVRHLVQSLIESGFEVLIIDTSQHCPGDSLGAGLLLHRLNFGLDFASWNAGLDFLGINTDSLDQLLLINDSCYGPFSKLSSLFEDIDRIEADVVSLTDGWFGGYHLQSNFILLKNEALKNSVFEVFFSTYGFPVLKSSIVREGEIGFSKYLLVNGYRLRAVFSYEKITKSFVAHCQENSTLSALSREVNYHDQLTYHEENWLHSIYDQVLLGRPLNITHTFWAQLLDEGFPFVKKDLILSNPTEVPNLTRFQETVIGNFGFRDFSNIKHDVQLRGKIVIQLD
jgi:rhamnosyltransferase